MYQRNQQTKHSLPRISHAKCPREALQNGIGPSSAMSKHRPLKERSLQKQSIQGDSCNQPVQGVNPSGRMRYAAGPAAYFLGAVNECISPSLPGSNAFSNWHRGRIYTTVLVNCTFSLSFSKVSFNKMQMELLES